MFNTRARINYYGDKNGLYRYSGCNGPVSAINGGPTIMNEHYRALRAPLPYIKFVERSVRVPTTGISSDPGFTFLIFMLETDAGGGTAGAISGSKGMENLDVGGLSGSASR